MAGVLQSYQGIATEFRCWKNVNGLLSTIHESVCTDLEAEGYEVRTFCVPAYAVSAPHERYRVFIIGISKGKSRLQTDTETNTDRTRWKSWTSALFQPWDYLPGSYWAIHKPPVCGVDDGISDRVGGYKQYKEQMQCYGNAVVPQQVYPVFKVLKELLDILEN